MMTSGDGEAVTQTVETPSRVKPQSSDPNKVKVTRSGRVLKPPK